jgi:hypothetical protein
VRSLPIDQAGVREYVTSMPLEGLEMFLLPQQANIACAVAVRHNHRTRHAAPAPAGRAFVAKAKGIETLSSPASDHVVEQG